MRLTEKFSGSDWFALDLSKRANFIDQSVSTLLYPIPSIQNPWVPFANQIKTKGFITFSFNSDFSQIDRNSSYNKTNPPIDTQFSESEKALARNELKLLSTMVDIQLVEISGTADLNFGHRNLSIGGYATTIWSNQNSFSYVIMEDQLNVDSSVSEKASRWDSIGTKTFLHELAHTLGFEHPETYRPAEKTNSPFLSMDFDTGLLTVMSYNDAYIGTYGPQTYMPLDIAGLRALYGDAKGQSPKSFFLSLENKSLSINTDKIYLNALAPNAIFDPSGQTKIDYSSIPSNYSIFADIGNGAIFVKQPKPVKFQQYDVFQNGAYTEPYRAVSAPANTSTDGVFNLIVSKGTVIKYFTGSQGNDTINCSLSNLEIDGSDGLDYVNFSSSFASHKLSNASNGLMSITNSTLGTYTLSNVERIRFSDKVIAFDSVGAAGQAYRLYQAALDRTPDERGLAGWIKFMDEGGSLTAMSQQFIDSQEFKTKYGALDNSKFVNQLYLNVLDRNGEPAGITGWVGGLANGLSRAEVLKGFSESSENQANVIGQIKNGIPYVEWWLA